MLTDIFIVLVAIFVIACVMAILATHYNVAPWSDRYPDDDDYNDDDDDYPEDEYPYVPVHIVPQTEMTPSGWLRGIRTVFAQIASTNYPVTDNDDELYPPLPDDAPYNVFSRTPRIIYSELDPDTTEYTIEHVRKLQAMAADVKAFMSHQDMETALYISEMRAAA